MFLGWLQRPEDFLGKGLRGLKDASSSGVGWEGCSTWDAVQCRSMRVMYVLSDELPMHTGWLQAGFPWKLWKHPGGLPALAWSACPEKRGLITSLWYLTDM